MDSGQSKAGVANYAAVKIGAPIFNFGDGSSSDKVITPLYPQCLKFLLEECPWSFGTKTVVLQTLAITPIVFGDGATIAYALPPDFLKIYQINFPYALIRFEFVPGSGYVLLSDTAGLIMKYHFYNDDPTTYSAKFYEALACKVAKEACFKLVEAQQYIAQMAVDYEKAFLSAAAADGQLSSPDQVQQSEWEFARLAGSSGMVFYPSGNIGFYPWYPTA